MNKTLNLIPGLLLSVIIALVAWFLGTLFPVVGGPVFGILLGMIAAMFKKSNIFISGIQFTSKTILKTAIILLGFGIQLTQIMNAARQSLVLMLFTLSTAFITAFIAGRLLRIHGKTSTLIGVGTAICGGSAIAAVAPVIDADDRDIAFSISTIFLFNIAAVFLFPPLGRLLEMSDKGFGLWAGTAINDTSSVVAAAYSFSDSAGEIATVVKLTRTLMIIPVSLFLAVYTARKGTDESDYSIIKIFPWFILGFLITSVVRSLPFFPEEVSSVLVRIGKFMIITAMSAIGLNTRATDFLKNGIRPVLLGLICWAAVAFSSIGGQIVLRLM